MRTRAVLTAVVTGALLVVGCGGDDAGDEELGVAAELVDTMAEGWNSSEPDVIVSVFAEDAEYDTGTDVLVGREAIRSYVEANVARTTDVRAGDVEQTSEGTYIWVLEIVLSGTPHQGVGEIELEDGLISRLGWQEFPVVME